jgi:ATP-dependent Lon protease
VTAASLPKLLGPPQLSQRKLDAEDQIGVATTLAWTENGGDVLSVEVLKVPGKGNLQITGQLGEVMQESAQAALSYIRSRCGDLGIRPEAFEENDIHIHVPEGAMPKDGPSAGITMATALASAMTSRPVRRDVGLSGEITLRGRVLPIGGVREKVLAAYRLKMQSVVLPEVNEKDLMELPPAAKRALDFQFVSHMDQVLEIALRPATPSTKRKGSTKKGRKSAASFPSSG